VLSPLQLGETEDELRAWVLPTRNATASTRPSSGPWPEAPPRSW
jgi:hypothetical protein